MTTPRIVPILAGGGTRLPAHIGILTALQELGIRFEHLVGVSGGSIVGALYAAGHSVDAINQVAMETDFGHFLSQSLFKLLRSGGLSSGDQFEEWMDAKLKGVTFQELAYDFHVVATDVRTGEPVIFDKTRTPDLKVSAAVRFSMSIPILFSFKPFKHHLLVDGSILSEEALQRDWSDQGDPVVCFRLRSTQAVVTNKRQPLIPLKLYLGMLIRTFMTTMSREYISDAFWHSTVIVHTGAISPIDFRLSKEQKQQLFKAGYDTARSVVPFKLNMPSATGPAVDPS
ncbi:MAG: NTE family protein [Motiliproteus sp.]|jgi:NTE family protein